MIRLGRDLLGGRVEVAPTYVGGEEERVTSRYTVKKAIVAVAVEILEPKGFGRIRLRRIPDVSGSSLVGFVQQAILRGSAVLTDGWKGYGALSRHGYTREKTVLLDWTGRQIRSGKKGAIPAHLAPIFNRLSLEVDSRLRMVEGIGKLFWRVVGRVEAICQAARVL